LTAQAIAGVSSKIRCPTETRQFGTDEQVKASVASALKYCWSRWHEGREKVFSEDGVLCDVCVRFEAGDPRQVSGITSYLDGMSVGAGSLAEYIAKKGNTIPDSINTGVPYAVVFRYVGFADPVYADIHLVPHTADAVTTLECRTFPVGQTQP
jgi:hypothetical protein